MVRRPRVIGVVTVAGAENRTEPWVVIVTLRQQTHRHIGTTSP